ncbi:sigma-70 family RNA polymerase sigma factor [Bacillus marinisedimentorum]|uniref:sigma-70 family RNA polymerase sigma factor n=1 Tax=Bacillus marinisedimentorum TaxID=1821260 RepID=UPI000872F19C|nr:sigma-70 family RNA polymerase sigma factor [Bacillus marinisedimentorum]
MERTNYAIETMSKDELLEYAMNEFGNDVLYLAYSYVNDYRIAEDLAQEAFVKFYKRIDTFKWESSLKTWLLKITANHCKDYKKSWYNRMVSAGGQFNRLLKGKDLGPEQTILKRSDQAELSDRVLSLPIKYREVIYLFYFEDMSLKEVADCLILNLNTVKTRMARAKELLKKTYEEGGAGCGE